jgi:hypothetical protein
MQNQKMTKQGGWKVSGIGLMATVLLVATALLITGGGVLSLPQPVWAEEPVAVLTSNSQGMPVPLEPVPLEELPGRNVGEVLKLVAPDNWARLSPSEQEKLLNKRFGIDFPLPLRLSHYCLLAPPALDQTDKGGPVTTGELGPAVGTEVNPVFWTDRISAIAWHAPNVHFESFTHRRWPLAPACQMVVWSFLERGGVRVAWTMEVGFNTRFVRAVAHYDPPAGARGWYHTEGEHREKVRGTWGPWHTSTSDAIWIEP